MYAVLSRYTVRPEWRADFVRFAQGYAAECLRDEGCTVEVSFVQDEGDPGPFYAYATYRDRAAYEAHLEGDAFKRAMAMFAAALARPPLELATGPTVARVTR